MYTMSFSNTLMGYDCVVQFEVSVLDFGYPGDPWGCDPGAGPEFSVDACRVSRDEPDSPVMEATGEFLKTITNVYHDNVVEEIGFIAQEIYHTDPDRNRF